MICTMFVVGFAVGITLLGGTAANAKSQPAPADSSLTPNVFIDYVSDSTGQLVVQARQFDHMETDPVYEPCAPTVCGTFIVTRKGQTSTLTLSKLASETIVSGGKSYSNADYSQYHYYSWDGSTIPLSRKYKESGKPVSVPLTYASVQLYLEGAPGPPFGGPCCK